MKVLNVGVGEGNLYMINTEDGPTSTFDYYVVADTLNGKEVVHNKSFTHKVDAQKLVDKVKAADCDINLEDWDIFEPRPSYALGEVDEVSLMDDEERFYKGL